MGRKRWVTKPFYEAECEDCKWKCSHNGALGAAARHHDKTKHTVRTESHTTVYYETEERILARFGNLKPMRG